MGRSGGTAGYWKNVLTSEDGRSDLGISRGTYRFYRLEMCLAGYRSLEATLIVSPKAADETLTLVTSLDVQVWP